MHLPPQLHFHRQPRRGVVLLVVLALLTLFAAVGIAFVIFSEQEAISAQNSLQGQEDRRPDADLLTAYALNQFVFDSNNLLSALQTQSLLVNMYGPSGNAPFNGPGRRHQATCPAGDPVGATDPYYFPNFQLRNFNLPGGGETWYGSMNAPYTFIDQNSVFLGAMGAMPGNPGQSVIFSRSFVRPGPGGFNPYDPANFAFWTNVGAFPLMNPAQKRAMVFRPGPWDHPNFPPPADAGGDIKNLPPDVKVWVNYPNSPPIFADNDSYWTDLGFPDQTGAEGKRYRPLFAFFIMDLDGRANLNVAGNVRGIDSANNANNLHVSNKGLAQSEINLSKVLVNPWSLPLMYPPGITGTGEMPAVFLGTPALNAPFRWYGRYGVGPNDKSNATLPVSPSGLGPILPRVPPLYSKVDHEGTRDWGPLQYNPSLRFILPGGPGPYGGQGSLGYDRFPRYWQGDPPAIANPNPPDPANPSPLGYPRDANDILAEYFLNGNPTLPSSPMGFNPFSPGKGNRVFGAFNMDAILRQGGTGTDALVSDVRRLLPNSISNPAVRRVVTTHSGDVDRPGLIPYNDGSTARLQLNAPANQGGAYTIQGGPIPFPVAVPPANQPPANSEFTATWRSALAASGRIDLNRPLPDYPLPDPTTGGITNMTAFNIAQTARQNFAADIYMAMVRAAGAFDPFSGGAPTAEQINALRFLAHTAANIVDQIDNDDYMTPFNWGNLGVAAFTTAYNAEWVFGTELPRLVINEAYVEHPAVAAGTDTKVNVWVELYNPLKEDPALRPDYFAGNPIQATDVTGPSPRGGVARLEMPASGTTPKYSIYQVLLTSKNANIRAPNNVLGNPDAGTTYTDTAGQPCVVSDFTDPAPPPPPAFPNTEWVLAGDNYFEGVNGKNYGFYLLGPKDAAGNSVKVPGSTLLNTLSRPEMQYTVPAAAGGPPFPRPTIILRRLACPHLPPNTTPGAGYNPYVTVDYTEDVADNVDSTPIEQRASVGRVQPYRSFGAGGNQQKPQPVLTGQPQNTFFTINLDAGSGALAAPPPVPLVTAAPRPNYFPADFKPFYDWLVHLDRELISPMELLQVSWYKPHELTQQFVTAQGNFQQTQVAVPNYPPNPPDPPVYVNPWFDQRLRLYRALELFETRSRMSSMGNVTVQGTTAVTGGTTATVTLGSNGNLFNPTLSTDLNAPSGITPGGGAFWSIRAGATLIIDNGLLSEERVLVTGVTATSFSAYFQKDHMAGFNVGVPVLGSRQPGKININTAWADGTYPFTYIDPNTGQSITVPIEFSLAFRALCDAQGCNSFTSPGANPDLHIDQIFTNLRSYRPLGSYGLGYTDPGDSQWPNGIGINTTLLASNQPNNAAANQTRLLEDPPASGQALYATTAHPYLRYELMTKLFNNVTVRSNAFAIWCTVGFFSVDNQGRLGPEIGRADGKQVRHRFFAIVDRSPLDPWVQTMNALVQANTGGRYVYDVAKGAVVVPNASPTPPPDAGLIIPLLGSTNFDPRKDYATIPSSLGLPSGPPATVLYWSVIE